MTQLRKNALLNAVGNTAYNGLQWLITVIVARHSLYSSGILAAAMSVSLTFRAVAYFGIHDFLVSDTKNHFSYSDYAAFRFISSISAFLLCLIFSIISNYDTESIWAITLYMLFRISESCSDLYYGIMQKNDRLDMVGIFMTVKAAATTLIFFITFFSFGLSFALLLMSVLSLIITFTVERHCIGKFIDKTSISFSSLKALVSEVLPIFVCQIETAVIFNLPQYLISVFFDKTVLGAYSSIFSLSLIIQAVFQYIYTPYIVRLAELSAQKSVVQFKKLLLSIIKILILVTVIFFILASIFGKNIISALFGSKMLEYSYMILPLISGVCCYSAMSFAKTISISSRNIKAILISHTLGLIINIPLTMLLIKYFGVNGASYGFTAVTILIMLIMYAVRTDLSSHYSKTQK